ncbi:MAG TPA: hypothetical protein DCW93_06260, partial [Saprospirales bacterium]|nr:hypothetical protein [Saprospirales bacterium]
LVVVDSVAELSTVIVVVVLFLHESMKSKHDAVIVKLSVFIIILNLDDLHKYYESYHPYQ